MQKGFYITTTLPYVNAQPHIGFALEIIQADVIARLKREQGYEVFFNTGTDEHGQKIYQKALSQGKTPQEYVDEQVKNFQKLKKALNLSYDNFIRTTDQHHIKAAQELWKRVERAGFIEKGIYKAKYCVGCEMEKTDSELVNGRCPLHPNRELEIIEEENYFFKFREFADKLLDLYAKNKLVVPDYRLKEVSKFVKQGLKNFSISRVKQKMPWGIPVPNDKNQVMYVWFDALTNYISALDWPENQEKWQFFWGTKEEPRAIQIAGKDNLRQQAAIWQAMLLAAGLPPSKQIMIHGFITSGGQKMSKSLGNVINPLELVKEYGREAVRYFLLAKIHPFKDSDVTREKLEMIYKDDLANGLGNLVARIESMAKGEKFRTQQMNKISKDVEKAIEKYRFDQAMQIIWEKIGQANKFINKNEVWRLKGKVKKEKLQRLVNIIREIATDLKCLLPETSKEITARFGGEIKKNPALFPKR